MISMDTSGGHELALVTGSAHRLGREIALKLARMGFNIALHYHKAQPQAEQTAVEIQNLGVTAHIIKADLTNHAEIENLFFQITNIPGQLSVMVNSAAIMPRVNLLDMNTAAWDDTFNLNLRAPWLCSKHAARLMKPGNGNIINITDAGAGRAWTGFAAYSISKSALETLTRLLARTLAPHIRVNGIAPGLIFPSPDMSQADWDRLVERLPLQKTGQPQNICQAVEYILTNTHITGQILVVDGGYQLI